MMLMYLKKQYAVVLTAICIGAFPAFSFAGELPKLPQPIEKEGRIQNVEPYDCTDDHRYWCGRITGTVWLNDANGNVVGRYLKNDTTMLLNGNSTYFKSIKPGDKAKIIYFEDEMWASSLEIERKGF